jgi:hypothetical protein
MRETPAPLTFLAGKYVVQEVSDRLTVKSFTLKDREIQGRT